MTDERFYVESPESDEPTDEERTILFVKTFRSVMGLPPIAEPANLREGLGSDVSLFRHRAPGRQFAITSNVRVKDALLKAGAGGVTEFRRVPESSVAWFDVQLPPYTWTYI